SPDDVPADHVAGPVVAVTAAFAPAGPERAVPAPWIRGRDRMMDADRVAAHAKINLFLRILAREASGFHQIETAFALLELADELQVRRIDAGVELEVNGPDLGATAENLAVRAARAVLEATGNRFGVAIALTKRIPVRAGLGGGS